ncbi:MAG: type II secretion system F family protein [Candidatus Saccharicenans sp.]|uniref:type II secretion system F family protein n=1 Tax=Candidatus Saccharicenans sp. TaxID=2819258 RepID=UPI00404B81A3
MPAFICRIVTSDGRILKETVLAASVEGCRRKLESEGLCVLSIRKELKLSRIYLFCRKIKPAEFILFNQELVALLKAGYPVLKSLELVEKRVENQALLDIIRKVESEVRGGRTLSEAFAPYENLFSKVYTASLMAGERSGNLPGSLTRYIQYAKVIDQTRGRVRSALLYPTLLVIFSAVLISLLVGLVLPRFATFYADFGAQLPGLTRFLLKLAIFIRANLVWIGLVLLVLILAYLVVRKKSSFTLFQDRLKLRMPFFRFLIQDSAVALYSRTLGLLLEAGITLLSSVSVAALSVPNRFIASRLQSVADSLKNGLSLYDSLQKTEVLPQLAMDMIRIGESSANLPGMLAEVADFYDDRLRDRIQTLVSLIEPVIIIFIGLVAAGMILSIYLPIFNIIRITR